MYDKKEQSKFTAFELFFFKLFSFRTLSFKLFYSAFFFVNIFPEILKKNCVCVSAGCNILQTQRSVIAKIRSDAGEQLISKISAKI